jgi:hypothetical protein
MDKITGQFIYTVICSFIIQWINDVPFLRCTRRRTLPQRGGSSWQRIFFILYARCIVRSPTQHTHIWFPCLFAVQLTLSSGVLRIYGNCTVLLNYCPWMKSSSKQGKLLTWMKRRWLRLTYDVFLVVESACYCNQLYNALHVSDNCLVSTCNCSATDFIYFLDSYCVNGCMPCWVKKSAGSTHSQCKNAQFFFLLALAEEIFGSKIARQFTDFLMHSFSRFESEQ